MSNYQNCYWNATGDLEYIDGVGGPGSSNHVVDQVANIPISRKNMIIGGGGNGPSSGLAMRNTGPPSRDHFDQHRPHGQQMQQQAQPKIGWDRRSNYYNQYRKKVPKYYFKLPYKKLYEMVDEFGAPSVIDIKKGGRAIWNGRLLKTRGYNLIKQIDLVDEQVLNKFPIPHTGCLYLHVKMKIPTNRIGQVLSLCGDISYDPVKNILIVRGVSLNYNIALIALICRFINGEISYYDIINKHLVKKVLKHQNLTNPKKQEENLSIMNKFMTRGT
jgi:hypothetical protein